MPIPVETSTAIGWLESLEQANDYFLNERLDSTYWDALTTISGARDEKTAVLKMAYNRIRLCNDFSVPSSPTTAQTERLKYAQCELAYYLAQHLAGEDSRKGIQAQGVTAAGVVKESYDTAGLMALPIPASVRAFLEDFKADETHFYSVDIDRDEDESVSYDPTDV